MSERSSDVFPTIKPAKYWERENNKIRCLNCFRKCLVTPGSTGFCKTRSATDDGKFVTTVYGALSSMSLNPIEKKPLHHYFPGSYALTVGTWSCNLICPWCQNYELSKTTPDPRTDRFISPEILIKTAEERKADGISFSFNEPSLLAEYALDVIPLATEKGLYAQFVTNGTMSLNLMSDLFKAGLTGMTVTVKGRKIPSMQYTGQDTEHTWKVIQEAQRLGIHVEIVLLIVTGFSDDEHTFQEISSNIKEKLSLDTPLHVNSYFPAYEYHQPSTSASVLDKAYQIAKNEGLNYVYVGNVSQDPRQNTYCPQCGTLLLERSVLGLKDWHITDENQCPHCKEEIPIVRHLEYMK